MSVPATSQIPAINKPHLKPKTLVGYGLGDAGCNIAFQMTGLFLLLFYTNVVGIRADHAGVILMIVKVWDAFADLFAGRMVDRTMTRWGKFRPFLIWYSIPLLLSNLLCFWIPVDGYGAKLAWATISYALMGLLYSMVNIPYGSLAGAMSQNPVDRSRLASARMVGSGATILLLSLFLAPRIKGAENLAATFLITAVAFVIIGALFFFTTFATSKEVVYREVERVTLKETIATVRQNGPLIRLCGSSLLYLIAQNVIGALTIYLSTYVLTRYSEAGWVATISIVITTGAVLYVGPFGPTVTRVLGKKRGFMYAAILAAVGGVLFSLSNFFWYSFALSLLGLFFMGVGMGILNTMTWALEADTVEYGEYRTGIRTEGATYSAFSFTRKVGQAVGVAVAGYVLTWSGFDAANTVQSEDTVRGMALGAGLVPAVIFLGAMLIMAGYPLTEAKFKDIMKAIEANRQLRHEQLQHGEIPNSVPTREDRVGPTARDSHPMTTQSPVVPPKDDDDAPSA